MSEMIELRLVVCTCGDAEQYVPLLKDKGFYSLIHKQFFEYNRIFKASGTDHDAKMPLYRAHFLFDSHDYKSMFVERWGETQYGGDRPGIIKSFHYSGVYHPDIRAFNSLVRQHVESLDEHQLHAWLAFMTPANWEPPTA